MSYCRLGKDSDVYLIQSIGGYEFVFAYPRPSVFLPTIKKALQQCYSLRNEGLKVPDFAIDRLLKERANSKKR